MATIYTEEPHNFSDIESYVIVDKKVIISEIITGSKCFFYDTCSLIKNSGLKNPEPIFNFIKKQQGIVIITRCVLMELASKSGCLKKKHADYIKKMYDSGIKVLIMYEEDTYDILDMCFSSTTEINQKLTWAVKTVKMSTGTVNETLRNDTKLMDDVVLKGTTDKRLFARFFRAVRSNKVQDDNLGEELITICAHLLSNLPEKVDFKYIIFTDDKGAVGMVNKASKNIIDNLGGKKSFSAITIPRLAQLLYAEHDISSRKQLWELLSCVMTNGRINIVGREKYDLRDEIKTFSCDELTDKIMTPNGIAINQ